MTGQTAPLFFYRATTEDSEIYIVPKGLKVSFQAEHLLVPEGVSIHPGRTCGSFRSSGKERAQTQTCSLLAPEMEELAGRDIG